MPQNRGRESPKLESTAQLSCPSRPPSTVKRSNRNLDTLGVETLAKMLGLHQLGAHPLPAEWLLGASTGGLCSAIRHIWALTDTLRVRAAPCSSPHAALHSPTLCRGLGAVLHSQQNE